MHHYQRYLGSKLKQAILKPALQATLLLAVVLTAPLHAQQKVPFANGVPVAPEGLADFPLGDGPWAYATAEGMDIKVELVTRLEYPMALTFLPDRSMLVVTRKGELHRVIDNKASLVDGAPEALFAGESGGLGTVHGYVDIVLHPDFTRNQLIYLVYNKALPNNGKSVTLGRGRWNGHSLEDFSDIFGGTGEITGVSRITFGADGKIYMTTNGKDPQTMNTIGGKVLRLNDDGSTPTDNPFAKTPGARPEIYSLGHRSALGITTHPSSGAIWQTENGPNGGDEVNIIEPGLNYGWPLVSLGRTYQGPWQAELPTHAGFQPPVAYWMPAIAVSGMTFYTGDAFPKWKGDLFVGALRTGEIPGTGHLERILFNDQMEELRRETLLADLHKRVRDVQQGPDGFIYLALEESDGGVLRIRPAP